MNIFLEKDGNCYNCDRAKVDGETFTVVITPHDDSEDPKSSVLIVRKYCPECFNV